MLMTSETFGHILLVSFTAQLSLNVARNKHLQERIERLNC